ncbi:MAG: hypothetical protein GQ535_03605 [Rhodobacteraceae bacterium]|nr:hypothetical protein [Paracoccaceae bacterium]
MKNRPLFKKSIMELEAAFKENQSNQDYYPTLLEELSHRSTQRAQRLKNRIITTKKVEPTFTSPPPPRQISSTTEVPKGESQPANDPRPEVQSPRPRFQPGPKPAITNDPQNILRAWTALEVLAPQGYRREIDLVGGDKYRIAYLDRGLPWENGEKSRPNKRLYYELILGTINLGPAVEALLKLYSDSRPDAPSSNRHSPIASILLDKNGCPLDEASSFAISSFAWGVPIALQGDLSLLADWTQREHGLIKAFKERLIKKDRNGDILPLKKSHVKAMFEHLVGALQLEGHDISPPHFAIRRYEFFASKVPPEPGLLNSFFLQDLTQARELARASNLPKALKYYLGVSKPENKVDLLLDDKGLQDILQPSLTPLGRWPANGRFPLALLQQAAVNITTDTIKATGIASVNGPPGTGKTTLLRDIVAARIIERASVMAEFQNPATAFSPTNQFVQRQGAKITLHRLDDRLKGFEMVVASSNNKAVENVSAELPALDAIASDAPNLRYFKSVSDNVLGSDTWGMISAVLGNSSNRYQFSQKFWRDEENGLSAYLNHISGIPQFVLEPQEDGAEPKKRPRKIITEENPPNNLRDALAKWKIAKAEFSDALAVSKATQNGLQQLHDAIVRLVQLAESISGVRNRIPALELLLKEKEAGIPELMDTQQKAHELNAMKQQERDRRFQDKPGFFARLFRTQTARTWQIDLKRLDHELRQHNSNVVEHSSILRDAQQEIGNIAQKTDHARDDLGKLERQHAELNTKVSQESDKLDVSIPDESFFSRTHEDKQLASLWFDQAANLQRDAVFEKAIALHKAFVDCAADPLRQNLSIFVESFGTRSFGHPSKDALIADLWSSFFLVVPVVSTTFASVNSMFSRLDPETLGWLLIDEAGQALPQAAVGAIMRSKHAVVVGDPLQIQPVVTLPNTLTEEICAFFGIDPTKYNAPEASAQTVADMASPFCAHFPTGSGHRDVGAPLLVHRRCDDPMFDISNEIAYSNLMVQAKKPSGKDRPLGRSCWFDVVGKPGPDKWCADEADKLIELIQKLRASGNAPDMYVVTPFVIVRDNLRRRLIESKVLEGWVDTPSSWVYEHVGTVHTVQGREADTVFFVLGAQKPSQNGARSWAGGKPNLANVAITRAKTSLYVIGNRELWKTAGVFSVLDRFLEKKSM